MPEADPTISRRAFVAGATGSLLFGTMGYARSSLLATALRRKGEGDVRLRGFGRLRAAPLNREGVKGLSIVCEDASKADLLLAKFRGDVTGFGFVEPIKGGWKVADGAYVAAFRQGSRVTLAFTDRPDALPTEGAVFEPAATVPTYLDRWDKHGLLFYYSAWMEPPGFDGNKQRYDFASDFEFTQKTAQSGLVFWEDEAANDSAEGLMNSPWWDWGRKEALRRGLPVHINAAMIPTTWLLNRYREDTALKMPQYSGSFYRVADPRLGGNGIFAWGDSAGVDAELGTIQSSIRRFAGDPNIIGWQEPHSELGHGKQQLFLEYGPSSARSFREFVRNRHRDLAKLNTRWGTRFASWEAIQAPELAEFLGWNEKAFDLTGRWKIRHEELPPGETYDPDRWRVAERRMVKTVPAPKAWFERDFDDREWGGLDTPGDDRTMFLPKRPAVFRRQFDLPEGWNAQRERVWLYVWDLNMAEGDLVAATINDHKVGEHPIPFWTPQWCVFEVTEHLRGKNNLLALRLPNGYLGYRTYLSTTPPKNFPYLGPEMNARWVDFADWQGHLRFHGLRRGAEMIRQVDPNRPITYMSPDVYVDASKDVCERYGGSMHDTGLMGAFWCDLSPMLSRSSNLAYDVEPGGPSGDAEEFRRVLGLWLTEGIQGISYFMHVGDVIWRDDVRAEFERMRPMIALLGKHHVPKAEVALLLSQRCERMLGYPWTADPNAGLANGYWIWNVGANLLPLFPRDAVTELDFDNGNVDPYRVVIDTSTTVTSPELLGSVERWVRAGGVFVAFMQTGRHDLTEPDAWPISKLTGYDVASVERYDEHAQVPDPEWRRLRPAPGQSVYSPEVWKGDDRGNGLRLRRREADCKDLMLWEDGSVAVGMRPLGKGYIVHVGAKFSHNGIFDRIEVGGNSPDVQRLTRLFEALLDWQKVGRVPGSVGDAGSPVLMRHTVSNTGLFDVWTLTNRTKTPQSASLRLSPLSSGGEGPGVRGESLGELDPSPLPLQGGERGSESEPKWCREVSTRSNVPLSALTDLRFESLQTRIFVTPRANTANATEWFAIQSGWWRESQKPSAKKLPTSEGLQRHARSLDEDWAFRPLTEGDDAASFTHPGTDDSRWERRRIGVWGLGDHGDVRRALLRKRFVVPKDWTRGAVELWIQSWTNTTFLDRGRVFLDGKPLRDSRPDGLVGVKAEGLVPGSSHVLAIEIVGEGQLRGIRGNAWLAYLPEPQGRIDLAGTWIPSPDALHDDPPVQLPGAWNALMARRSIHVDERFKDKVATICVVGESRVLGVIVNGRYVRRHHHGIGERTSLNISPWVRFGETNEILLVSWDGPSTGRIESVELQFFDRDTYA